MVCASSWRALRSAIFSFDSQVYFVHIAILSYYVYTSIFTNGLQRRQQSGTERGGAAVTHRVCERVDALTRFMCTLRGRFEYTRCHLKSSQIELVQEIEARVTSL